jgi:hypothetical protein
MISQRWINQQKTLAASMGNADKKAAKLAEIANAEAELESQKEQLASAGFIVNSYPGTCAVNGTRVQGGEGYVRQEAGRWVTYSKAGAATVVGM